MLFIHKSITIPSPKSKVIVLLNIVILPYQSSYIRIQKSQSTYVRIPVTYATYHKMNEVRKTVSLSTGRYLCINLIYVVFNRNICKKHLLIFEICRTFE